MTTYQQDQIEKMATQVEFFNFYTKQAGLKLYLLPGILFLANYFVFLFGLAASFSNGLIIRCSETAILGLISYY